MGLVTVLGRDSTSAMRIFEKMKDNLSNIEASIWSTG